MKTLWIVAGGLLGFGLVIWLRWRIARRRRQVSSPAAVRPFLVVGPDEKGLDPYVYVYVNADGTVRELDQSERAYLETMFHGADSGRPYIKNSYEQKNGWGEIRGFLRRSKLPAGIIVQEAKVPESGDGEGSQAHVLRLPDLREDRGNDEDDSISSLGSRR